MRAFGVCLAACATAGLTQSSQDDFGGAKPKNRHAWFTLDDYPNAAAEAGEQGNVSVTFVIGSDGRISDCQVVGSSQHPRLDVIPCKLLLKRARFKPAKDAAGNPVATRGRTSMLFWLG
jgi:protein TonB